MKNYRQKNPLQAKIQSRDQARRRRLAVLAYLGNKCVRCGFTDARALQVDHILGGGHKDRATSHISDYKVLAGLPGYQLLCANCNWIKRVENGETA